ncbi:Shikimate kinase 2 [Pirellula sp. SH-Sr6A]|nr:Shikimate kinase 2 [Pirellula sp. SH-Sr6A]
MVEASAGTTIANIFANSGEEVFRDLESAAIRSLSCATTPSIVALGGGAILRPQNLSLLKASGWVAWLQASPQTLANRISGDQSTASRRPALSQLGVLAEIEAVLAKRLPLYREAADQAFDTEANGIDSVVEQIAEAYQRIAD